MSNYLLKTGIFNYSRKGHYGNYLPVKKGNPFKNIL